MEDSVSRGMAGKRRVHTLRTNGSRNQGVMFTREQQETPDG